MVFSAAAVSFQKPASADRSSIAAILCPNESKPPPGFVNFRFYSLYGNIQFAQQHDNLSTLRIPEKSGFFKGGKAFLFPG
jgi:hypothetical protein